MSKRTNIHHYYSNNPQSHKKQTRVPKVEKRKSKDSDRSRQIRQFRSIQNHQNNQLTQEDQLSIDRLDLIFQKEPKDIQQKLINLLISYNAVMHYNNETDMFQVDLLLPFLDEEQKREFIRQFLQIRKMKTQNRQNIYETSQWIGQEDQQLLKKTHEIRKFSFNAFENNHQNDNQHQIESKDSNSALDNIPGISQPEKKSIPEQSIMNKTGQFNEVLPITAFRKQRVINYSELDEVIARKLKSAFEIISKRKAQQYETSNTHRHADQHGRAILVNEDISKAEQSIIDQISNPQSFNNTQTWSEKQQNGSRQLSASQYIKDDQYLNQPTTQNHKDALSYRKHQELNYYSQHAPYIEIVEEPEETQYQPLFRQQNTRLDNNSGKNITSFEAFTKKYTSIKEQKSNKNKNVQNQFAKKSNQTKTIQSSQKNQNANIKSYQTAKNQPQHQQNKSPIPKQRKTTISISIEDNQNKNQINRQRMISKDSSHSNNRSKNKSHSPLSVQSRKINRQLEDFFQIHKKNLDNLYTQIRQKIHQKMQSSSPSWSHQSAKSTQKSLEDLYILVEDDSEPLDEGLSSIAEETDSSQFREEMIKQYHHEILVNNRNLSSQDLIRFFKYLHSNAKKLYIKYIKNKHK